MDYSGGFVAIAAAPAHTTLFSTVEGNLVRMVFNNFTQMASVDPTSLAVTLVPLPARNSSTAVDSASLFAVWRLCWGDRFAFVNQLTGMCIGGARGTWTTLYVEPCGAYGDDVSWSLAGDPPAYHDCCNGIDCESHLWGVTPLGAGAPVVTPRAKG